MKLICLIFTSLLSFAALADGPTMDCRAMIISPDFADGSSDQAYKAALESGSHGGQIFNLNFGDHKLEVASDGKWLAITWTKKGATVAIATSVRTENVKTSAVLILFNPANPDEQASVNCSLN